MQYRSPNTILILESKINSYATRTDKLIAITIKRIKSSPGLYRCDIIKHFKNEITKMCEVGSNCRLLSHLHEYFTH